MSRSVRVASAAALLQRHEKQQTGLDDDVYGMISATVG